jgi:hypothetical protein
MWTRGREDQAETHVDTRRNHKRIRHNPAHSSSLHTGSHSQTRALTWSLLWTGSHTNTHAQGRTHVPHPALCWSRQTGKVDLDLKGLGIAVTLSPPPPQSSVRSSPRKEVGQGGRKTDGSSSLSLFHNQASETSPSPPAPNSGLNFTFTSLSNSPLPAAPISAGNRNFFLNPLREEGPKDAVPRRKEGASWTAPQGREGTGFEPQGQEDFCLFFHRSMGEEPWTTPIPMGVKVRRRTETTQGKKQPRARNNPGQAR